MSKIEPNTTTAPLCESVDHAPPQDGSRPVLRLLLVGSSGGHLDQLLLLDDWLAQHDVAVAAFLKLDAVERVAQWRTYPLHWPTNRNLPNLLRNISSITVIRSKTVTVIRALYLGDYEESSPHGRSRAWS